ncbi:TetR/AcrR family transcriptional regulator [Streptomyces sp. 2P-4]|uniref:TetR/AcrR family transcriptional regulator n=1 Tax=Streptomyces sp. 2P-4 TaxID=2931974 RepID=UPI00254113E5|nr:TetR/AcrR family transcriptional regulator [Streptomyces sp. 2P-4]
MQTGQQTEQQGGGRRRLSTADERRGTVLRTAIGAFAARGYFGTTTTEVAKAAGISQAYVYRLFPNKEALFAAVVEHCFAQVRAALERGAAEAEGASPESVLASMGDAYARLISDNELLLVQLHAQAAAVSEPVIREAVRAGYAQVVEYVRGVSGGSERQVQEFFAVGMLCHLVVSLGVAGAGEAGGVAEAPWMRILAAGITHY